MRRLRQVAGVEGPREKERRAEGRTSRSNRSSSAVSSPVSTTPKKEVPTEPTTPFPSPPGRRTRPSAVADARCPREDCLQQAITAVEDQTTASVAAGNLLAVILFTQTKQRPCRDSRWLEHDDSASPPDTTANSCNRDGSSGATTQVRYRCRYSHLPQHMVLARPAVVPNRADERCGTTTERPGHRRPTTRLAND
jgi:hypothetical protein